MAKDEDRATRILSAADDLFCELLVPPRLEAEGLGSVRLLDRLRIRVRR